eukprot:TRINITY_DN67548_c5_g1_i1.p1 TRINITY_DN67548_c5_g1~~TRINITY_DN67548_c5_g1_i1.p1  ORF type:complete len:478 (-),score=57.47 TRINITY_DN67548_c5_g1_i1:2890-4323(-)
MSVIFDAELEQWQVRDAPVETTGFTVGYKNGFCPTKAPMTELPSRYEVLEQLLNESQVELPNGEPGLLAKNEFRNAVKERLPDYTEQVSKETDPHLLLALHRDLCSVASCYCFEPCSLKFHSTKTADEGIGGKYGFADNVLPSKLAMAMDAVGAKLKAFPWLDYTDYGLVNFKTIDESKGTKDPANLKAIRQLHGGKNENGFMIVHVGMEAHTGDLVRHGDSLLTAVEKKQHSDAQAALTGLYQTAKEINNVREQMWKWCQPASYMKLRTWIYGIKNTGLFPNDECIYEGCTPEKRSYRGETGAQSTIIPYLDTVVGLDKHYPKNELTDYLLELRDYRPYQHREFLSFVQQRASSACVEEFMRCDVCTVVCLLRVLNEIRAFRQGHWNFVKSYIIQNHDHPIATGGTPISTWLPNQLGATMQLMSELISMVKEQPEWEDKLAKKDLKSSFDSIDHTLETVVKYLQNEVNELRAKYNQ